MLPDGGFKPLSSKDANAPVRIWSRTMPPALDRWTRHGSIRTEHATVTGLGAKQRLAPPAFIKELTRIHRHDLLLLVVAMRTGDDGFKDNRQVHGHSPQKTRRSVSANTGKTAKIHMLDLAMAGRSMASSLTRAPPYRYGLASQMMRLRKRLRYGMASSDWMVTGSDWAISRSMRSAICVASPRS